MMHSCYNASGLCVCQRVYEPVPKPALHGPSMFCIHLNTSSGSSAVFFFFF